MLTEDEKRLEAIWTYSISIEKVLKRLVEKNIITQTDADMYSEKMFEQLNVNDIPGFRRSTIGEAMVSKHVTVASLDDTYMSLTEIARQKDVEAPSYVIQSWLRNYGTIEFLRLWEKESNPDFKDDECTELIEKMRSSSFTLTLKQWITKTGAIGITSKQGKNGGTYAHPDIACEFNMWINTAFRLDVIKKFRVCSDNN